VLNVLSDIVRAIDGGFVSGLVVLDPSSAFDTVDLSTLLLPSAGLFRMCLPDISRSLSAVGRLSHLSSTVVPLKVQS
jgi:hypothetical protein